MKVWGRKSESPAALSVARAANQGLSRSELLRNTLSALAGDGRADRIGVWLETGDSEITERQASVIFRGLVWDREGENVPAEW